MITQEFLQSCTDEQINKGVAWLRAKRYCNIPNRSEFDYFVGNGLIKFTANYCTNPMTAHHVIIESRIGTKPRGVDSDWYAYQGKIEVINSNPLRAAMEVYILVSVNK